MGILKKFRREVKVALSRLCHRKLNLVSDVGEFEERKRRNNAIISILHELNYNIVAFKTAGEVSVLNKAEEFNQDYQDDYIFAPAELTEKILEPRAFCPEAKC